MKKIETEHKMTVDFIMYPGLKDELESKIKQLLKEAHSSKKIADNRVKAIIVPHAAWLHCDKIMADAYAAVAKDEIEQVVILSRVHREPSKDIFLPEYLSYNTPLGSLDVDQKVLTKIVELNTIFKFDNIPHTEEHSIEVQLPFIKYLWPEAKIIPILTGKSLISNTEKISRALNTVLKNKMNKTLFIISSSLSSYNNENISREQTDNFISILNSKKDWFKLPELLSNGNISACSADCLCAVLNLLNEPPVIDVLSLDYGERMDKNEKRVCFGAITIT